MSVQPVERRPWVPDPLSIPKNLHKQLPYEYKPKLVPRVPKDDREALIKKHTVVLMEPHESRVCLANGHSIQQAACRYMNS